MLRSATEVTIATKFVVDAGNAALYRKQIWEVPKRYTQGETVTGN